MKYHHYTLSEIKTPIFAYVLACVSVHCVDQKQHSNPEFLTKSVKKILQTCVDVANEHLQAYNTGSGVKSLFLQSA